MLQGYCCQWFEQGIIAVQWRGVQAPCEHVSLHPAVLHNDCRVPEQSGETRCVLHLLHNASAEHKQSLERVPKQEKGC